MGSFYGLLGVTADATAEEIKLAFKRRVLQVHPDKGGSKEAFHLVYLAFETLADPEARKRYDDQRPTKLLPKQKAKPKKSKTKRAQPSEQKERTKPTPKPEHTSQTSGTSKQSASASKVFSHDKLLTKLCKLLKGLTREVRNDVIQKEFTQQQRVLLEKWMQNQHDAETETPAGETSDSQAASTMLVSEKDASDSQAATLHRGSEVVQEETCDATSSTLSLIPAQTKGKLIAQPERERSLGDREGTELLERVEGAVTRLSSFVVEHQESFKRVWNQECRFMSHGCKRLISAATVFLWVSCVLAILITAGMFWLFLQNHMTDQHRHAATHFALCTILGLLAPVAYGLYFRLPWPLRGPQGGHLHGRTVESPTFEDCIEPPEGQTLSVSRSVSSSVSSASSHAAALLAALGRRAHTALRPGGAREGTNLDDSGVLMAELPSGLPTLEDDLRFSEMT
eukprot:g23318.t1